MPGKKILLVMTVTCFAAVTGCTPHRPGKQDRSKPVIVPVSIRGTIAQYAGFIGTLERPVSGYGVVLGLGKKGSAEVPDHLRTYLIEYMHKRKLGFHRYGTQNLSPSRILRDLDTAAVRIDGQIPYGAPKGSRFDINITAVEQTQTISLDGGRLMPSNLHLVLRRRAMPVVNSRTLAIAGGEVFINPFVDPSKPAQRVKLRQGKIIAGGKVEQSRPAILVLAQPSYPMCRAIQDRINQRFRDPRFKVANALNDSLIKLRIPHRYRTNYRHFLTLILRLPLQQSDAATELQIRRILQEMQQPAAQYDDLSLILEAIGRQVVPMIQVLYKSQNPPVAFYTARTGLRLGDAMAGPTVLRLAQTAGSPMQLLAIEELGRKDRIAGARDILRELLNDPSEFVRVAAYEALLRRGDHGAVKRYRITAHFRMDVVRSKEMPVIYATQSKEAKIVLFGNIHVGNPVFFSTDDDLVTISSRDIAGKVRLVVFRKIPRDNKYSDPQQTEKIDLEVTSLIRLLGSPAKYGDNGKIQGLALTYSQVLRVLYGMCKSGDIKAKFVLQEPSDIPRIIQSAETVGRPDAPDE